MPRDVPPKVTESTPGEGIRSLKTSGVFRAVNFELYAKPNKYMIIFGSVAFASCVGYLMYMRQIAASEKKYVVILDENDHLVTHEKKSKWE